MYRCLLALPFILAAGPACAQTVASGGALPSGLTYPASNGPLTITSTVNNSIIVNGSNTVGTTLVLNNSTAGAHNFSFFTTGSGNNPGNFGVYDVTANITDLSVGSTGNVAVVSGAVSGWSSSANNAAIAADTGLSRTAAGILAVGNGTAGNTSGTLIAGLMRAVSDTYVTSTITYTSTTTLAAITGLTTGALVAGKVYAIDLDLYVTANASGGLKGDFSSSTATATQLSGACIAHSGTTITNNSQINGTALTATYVANTAAITDVHCSLTLVVNAGGTFVPTAAQNASFATSTTILTGSRMVVKQLN